MSIEENLLLRECESCVSLEVECDGPVRHFYKKPYTLGVSCVLECLKTYTPEKRAESEHVLKEVMGGQPRL